MLQSWEARWASCTRQLFFRGWQAVAGSKLPSKREPLHCLPACARALMLKVHPSPCPQVSSDSYRIQRLSAFGLPEFTVGSYSTTSEPGKFSALCEQVKLAAGHCLLHPTWRAGCSGIGASMPLGEGTTSLHPSCCRRGTLATGTEPLRPGAQLLLQRAYQ